MEQIDAYKRSLSAPWDSRAAILPVNKWDKGVGKAINFSYFSPYDVISQPFRATIKTIEEGKLKQRDVGDTVFKLFFGEDGPIKKINRSFCISINCIRKNVRCNAYEIIIRW